MAAVSIVQCYAGVQDSSGRRVANEIQKSSW